MRIINIQYHMFLWTAGNQRDVDGGENYLRKHAIKTHYINTNFPSFV